MQTVNGIIQEFRTMLSPGYERGELEQIIFLAFEHVCGFSKTDLLLKREDTLADEKSSRLKEIIERLKKLEPIQYIIGSTEFYGALIKVNPHVLIPRQETEELVDMIIKEGHPPSPSPREGERKHALQILDICTGSGCIAIVLKKNIPNSIVSAIDISEDALEVANENARFNHTPINFINADIFNLQSSIFNLQSGFDIIVSNPPYVMLNEANEMTERELNYEPHLAIFTPNEDALLFYRQIAEVATKNLIPGGRLYFEINEHKGKEICEMLAGKGFKDIVLKQDLNGKDRMVSCSFTT